MDKLSGFLGGSSSDKSTDKKTDKSGDKQDYADKAFDFLSKKAGHDFDRKTDEKITDGAREAYERMTGKEVSDKVSN